MFLEDSSMEKVRMFDDLKGAGWRLAASNTQILVFFGDLVWFGQDRTYMPVFPGPRNSSPHFLVTEEHPFFRSLRSRGPGVAPKRLNLVVLGQNIPKSALLDFSYLILNLVSCKFVFAAQGWHCHFGNISSGSKGQNIMLGMHDMLAPVRGPVCRVEKGDGTLWHRAKRQQWHCRSQHRWFWTCAQVQSVPGRAASILLPPRDGGCGHRTDRLIGYRAFAGLLPQSVGMAYILECRPEIARVVCRGALATRTIAIHVEETKRHCDLLATRGPGCVWKSRGVGTSPWSLSWGW